MDCFCVRKGTGVWVMTAPPRPPAAAPPCPPAAAPPCPPASGGEEVHFPSQASGRGGETTALRPIETLRPGDYVLAHDGLPHRVLHTFTRHYRGEMIGLRCAGNDGTLWLTADHRVLSRRRVQALSQDGTWSAVPPGHFSRARHLRRTQTPPERVLWQHLRNAQSGVKFRRQHPIGPYIADFYA